MGSRKEALERIVPGFIYIDDEDTKWNYTVCKIVARARHPFMGEPTFVIELVNGKTKEVVGAQLRPWYQVVDTSDDWLYYNKHPD